MGQNLLGFTIIAKAIHLTSPAVLNSYREPLMWEYLGGIENGFNPLIYWVLFLPAVAVPTSAHRPLAGLAIHDANPSQ